LRRGHPDGREDGGNSVSHVCTIFCQTSVALGELVPRQIGSGESQTSSHGCIGGGIERGALFVNLAETL
jgi:hypothetical protein